jgi:hypothetical protein
MFWYITAEYREPKPPENWPLWKVELFYKQPFRLQCFIYFKYRMNWPKRLIMKYLFLTSEVTYYKYDRIAKDIITKAFKSE